MVQNIDKRKCYRFEVPGGKVKYKKVKAFDFHKGFSIACRLINLSKGGVNFTYEEIIRKGKKLIVKLLIPDYEPLELLAKVSRQSSSRDDYYLTMRVVFMPFGTGTYMNPKEVLDVLRRLDAQYVKDKVKKIVKHIFTINILQYWIESKKLNERWLFLR